MDKLTKLALRLVLEKVEAASSALNSEHSSKEKGNVTKHGNPLGDASSFLSDARCWLNAVIEVVNHD